MATCGHEIKSVRLSNRSTTDIRPVISSSGTLTRPFASAAVKPAEEPAKPCCSSTVSSVSPRSTHSSRGSRRRSTRANVSFDLWFNVVDEEFSYFNKTFMDGNPVWFSVHEFLNNGMNGFLDQLPTLDDTRRSIAEKSLSKCNALDRLHSYTYHADDLKDEKLELEEVVEIFNRVNSKGTPLSRADLAMAHICTFWPKLAARFVRSSAP